MHVAPRHNGDTTSIDRDDTKATCNFTSVALLIQDHGVQVRLDGRKPRSRRLAHVPRLARRRFQATSTATKAEQRQQEACAAALGRPLNAAACLPWADTLGGHGRRRWRHVRNSTRGDVRHVPGPGALPVT
jgi:hypothetical protein